jgi:hypothetical protein
MTAKNLHDPHIAEAYAAILQATKLPVEHWPYVFVISDFGNGRTQFEATDEEIAMHAVKVLREGRLQAFLRLAVDLGHASAAEVEKLIAEEMEALAI